MHNNRSFLEKMNDANYGKKGMYIAIGSVVVIFLVKLLVVPRIEQYYPQPGFKLFRQIVNIVETIAVLNIIAFFLSIIFFRAGIGGKLVYGMQLRDHRYFKHRWILWWIRSLWVCILVLGITTVINQALFKSWTSFVFLLLFLSIPFYLFPRIKRNQQNFFN